MSLRSLCLALATTMALVVVAGGCGGNDGGFAPRADAALAADRPRAQADASDTLGLAPDVPATQPADGGAPAAVDGGAQVTDSQVATLDATARPEVPPPPPATIVVLPDTQYYSSGYPQVYAQQTQWIVDQTRSLNIEAVLHVGDLVDGFNDPKQWSVASTAMRVLDPVVPYVVVPGNHDTDANRETPIDTYFAPASMPWITGTMTAGQIENSYALLDIGAEKWLVVGIEFGPRDAVITWADSVLKAYPNNPAIVLTHAYLYGDGNRYDNNLVDTQGNHQAFIPQFYGYTANQGINDGEMMWQKLVLPNRNVRMVFCGHDSGAARLTSTRSDGSLVHQMLSDYQWWGDDTHPGAYFGYGWLRIVRFDYVQKTIAVQTYSPYLQEYLTDDANQFSLPWNL